MTYLKRSKVNIIVRTIAGGAAAALLSVPAFAQSKMNMNDCSKITPAYQSACNADNVMRTECNKTSNPIPCYNNKKAAASTPATTPKTPAAPPPAPAKPAAPPPAPAKPAAPPPAPAKPAAAPAAASTAPAGVPQGARACAKDGQKCLVAGSWTGVYGVNGKFAKISGSGDFVCLPGTFKINDPAPGVQKTCWVIGAAPAPAARPTTTAQPKVNSLPLSCKGGLMHNPVKTFTSTADFAKAGYGAPVAMAATSLDGATEECRTSCAKTGEPAPCGWFTLVQWREDTSATGKSRMVYSCYKVNARNYKNAFKPKMANDKNFGTPSNGLFFKESYTYPCAR